MKSQISQLEMLNANVSHELRNPLNCIAAYTEEKKRIYKFLSKITDKLVKMGGFSVEK